MTMAAGAWTIASGVIFGLFPDEWGPARSVTASVAVGSAILTPVMVPFLTYQVMSLADLAMSKGGCG